MLNILNILNSIFTLFLAITLGQIAIRSSVDLYFEIKGKIENEKTKHWYWNFFKCQSR